MQQFSGKALDEKQLFALLDLRLVAHYQYDSSISTVVAKKAAALQLKKAVPPEALWHGQWYKKSIIEARSAPVCAGWISPQLGWGVFAQKPIQKDEYISCYLGEIRYARELPINRYCFSFPLISPSLSFLRGRWTIDALHCGNISRFINHSDSPNCESLLAFLSPWPYIVLRASRDIAEGEQLSYDYGPQYWRHLEKQPLQ